MVPDARALLDDADAKVLLRGRKALRALIGACPQGPSVVYWKKGEPEPTVDRFSTQDEAEQFASQHQECEAVAWPTLHNSTFIF